MLLTNFIKETGEELQFWESPEDYVKRLNLKLQQTSIWDKKNIVPKGCYINFMFVKHPDNEECIYWSFHKENGRFYFGNQ